MEHGRLIAREGTFHKLAELIVASRMSREARMELHKFSPCGVLLAGKRPLIRCESGRRLDFRRGRGSIPQICCEEELANWTCPAAALHE
jgi:hypothetical protein